MLDIIAVVLSHWLLVDYMRLDGDLAVAERQPVIDAFNNGAANVFLLSTKAGGLGLNLTSVREEWCALVRGVNSAPAPVRVTVPPLPHRWFVV